MAATTLVSLRGPKGERVGGISIAALPTRDAAVPADRSNDPTRARAEPPIQLREAASYRYTVEIPEIAAVWLEPAELFDPDDSSRLTGRLRTQQYVGDVSIRVSDPSGGELGSAPVLVRAAKLEHEREYQRMLRDVADVAAEAVLQGFAPATTSTAILPSIAPRLLYQQFAILQARLADEELQDAIAEVVHRPQQDWVVETEWRPAGRPLRAGAAVARALTGPGPRVRTARRVGSLGTVPRRIPSRRTEETVDTVPNRFVKFALSRWRELAAGVGDILNPRGEATYAVRGLASVRRVIDSLDDSLSEPIFRQIGQLQELPTSNQVLLKRESYRQIFSTFALIESGLGLQLELDDAIHPSQRNVASLYEYWTFLKLAEVLGDACEDPRAPLRLFENDGDGLSLALRRGKQSKLPWEVSVAGRRLGVSLYFNRTFRATDDGADGSWSRPMVPDASVLIRPLEARVRVEGERDLDVWLHFDAKYKLDWSSSQFEEVQPEVEAKTALQDEEHETVGVSRRDDLLKMHAYRDAIRRSAGAYVLFPGTSAPRNFREFVELIPGLGAFPLRPGDDSGTAALRRFIDDVLLHAADQATAEERRRFWQARIFAGSAGSDRPAVSFLDRPPADSPILISWVPDERHWRWTDDTKQHVLQLPEGGEGIVFRAEELAAQLILLSGVGRSVVFERRGAWTIVDDDDLRVLGYPSPPIRPCLLCRLIPIDHQPGWLDELPVVELLARARAAGAPVLVSWSDLVRHNGQVSSDAATVPRHVPKPDRELGVESEGSARAEATAEQPGESVSNV
jgi:predicted component of viral defense system (DUF524 family)